MKLARLNRNTNISDVDITEEQVDIIFGNISTLIPINKQLCDALEERLRDWNEQSCIADIFLKMVSTCTYLSLIRSLTHSLLLSCS